MLERIQRGLESLYRISAKASVVDFLVRDESLAHQLAGRPTREALLVMEHADAEAGVGLYLDDDVLSTLARFDPSTLHEKNFAPFLLAVEGVSHFLYLAHCSEQARAVSALELELQGEVDKFAACVLIEGSGAASALGRRLFAEFDWEPGLSVDESQRYHAANDNARRFTRGLARRFLRTGQLLDCLSALRAFYRAPLPEKLGLAAAA